LGKARRRAFLIALLVAITGFFDVISAFYVEERLNRLRLLSKFIDKEVQYGTRTVTVMAGFVLMAIAWRLALRKREAWSITVWTLTITGITHLAKGLDIEGTIISFALLAILVAFRKDFTVRSDPFAWSYVLFVGPFALLFLLAYTLLGFWVFRSELLPHGFDVTLALSEGLNLLTWGSPKVYHPISERALWFLRSLHWIGPAALLYVVWVVTRPVRHAHERTLRDEKYVFALIRLYGYSPVSYFALMPDKRYFFDSSEEVVIPYCLIGNIPLALGDPIGPDSKVDEALKEWLETCESNDWLPGFYQTTDRFLEEYRSNGLLLLKIGEEAVIDLKSWTLSGKKKQNIRTALNKGKRLGWRFEMYDGVIGDQRIVNEIKEISEEWLGGRSELSFSMGGTHTEGHPEERISVAFDANGTVLGFLTWAPVYARHGWNLDLMRRRLDAPHGLMEYLITSSLLKFQEEGFKMASLGMAPLANISDGKNDFPMLAKALSLVYEKMSSVYAYKSLQVFKSKFGPDWEDRYLIYSSNLAAPQVLFAVVKAHVQDVSLLSMVMEGIPSPQKVVKSLVDTLAQQRRKVRPPLEED